MATLESQAVAATLGHAQALQPPTAAQVAEIVSFEMGVYTAQVDDKWGGALTANMRAASTVYGGPQPLAEGLPSFGSFALYDAWPSGPWAAPTDPTVRVPVAPHGQLGRCRMRSSSRRPRLPASIGRSAGRP